MFCIFIQYLRLTISTLVNVTDDMKLIDVNGNPHVMTPHQVSVMIIIGWVSFLCAWIMNILFYKVHPSSVDFSLAGLYKKMFIYICGRKISLRCSGPDEDETVVDSLLEMIEDEK